MPSNLGAKEVDPIRQRRSTAPQLNLEEEAPMSSTPYKHRFHSCVLGRETHLDVLELGASPERLLLLFGGSGVDEEEYHQYSKVPIQAFDRLLEKTPPTPLLLVHACAPYDVPFARFGQDPTLASNWNLHVLDEVLAPWRDLPFWVGGFSGGAALALNGVHADPRCRGGYLFGPDAIPARFRPPETWHDLLRVYVGRYDRVYQYGDTAQRLADLEAVGAATVAHLPTGGHRLSDYASPDAIGDAIRRTAFAT